MFLSRGGRDLGVAFQTHLRSQAWYIGEAKNFALLSSPNGYLLSPQSGLKGVRPPVEFEERPRDALQAMQEKKAFISRRRRRLVGFLELGSQCGISHEV